MVDAATRARHAARHARRSTTTSTPRPTASTSSSTTIRSRTRTSRRTSASRTTSTCGIAPAHVAHRSRSCRSRTACRSTACRPGRATSTGARPSRRRSCGPRRSTAATGTSKVPARDKVMMQTAPFTGAPAEIARTEQRFVGFDWGEQPRSRCSTSTTRTATGRARSSSNVDDAEGQAAAALGHVERRALQGSRLRRCIASCRTARGSMRQDGDAIYLSRRRRVARRRSPVPRSARSRRRRSPSACSAATRRRSSRSSRSPATPTKTFLTWHQSPTDPPNAFLRTLGARRERAGRRGAFTSTARAVTHIPDPTPAVRAIKKRLVKYKRKDGMDLSFTLYTPPGYKEGTRVPAILYAYPLDYADAAKAGPGHGLASRRSRGCATTGCCCSRATRSSTTRRSRSSAIRRRRTTRTSSSSSRTRRPRSTRRSRLGVVDRDRIGVTGHSHGALMTVNLLAHTDLFRAGVATSGSYNKTLTPFGFQNERRSVWEAQRRLPQGVAVLLRRQDEAAAAHHARRGRREPGHDAAPGGEALRGDPRQRRHRAPRDAAARAALVLGDGVERAARRTR